MYQRWQEFEGRLRKSRYLLGQERVLAWLPGLGTRALSPSGYIGGGGRQTEEGNKVPGGVYQSDAGDGSLYEPWLIFELFNEEKWTGRQADRSRSPSSSEG